MLAFCLLFAPRKASASCVLWTSTSPCCYPNPQAGYNLVIGLSKLQSVVPPTSKATEHAEHQKRDGEGEGESQGQGQGHEGAGDADRQGQGAEKVEAAPQPPKIPDEVAVKPELVEKGSPGPSDTSVQSKGQQSSAPVDAAKQVLLFIQLLLSTTNNPSQPHATPSCHKT